MDMNLTNDEQRIIKKLNLYPIISLLIIFAALLYIIFSTIENYKKEYSTTLKNKLQSQRDNVILHDIRQAIDEIEYSKKNTLNTLQNNLKTRVYEANMIIDKILKEHNNKSNDEIKKLIIDALGNLRFFNQRGYYFMYDNRTKTSLIHPIKKFINKDMSHFQDKKGQNLVRLYAKAINNSSQEGYANIYFEKPHLKDGKEYQKIVFVKYIKTLDWVIGTGDYLDDVENEIQQKVLKRLESIRFENNGYYWIHNTDNILLMHPFRKERVGLDDTNSQDSKGLYLTQEFVKTAQANPKGGFVDYHWYKPNSKVQIAKRSCVAYIEDWNWVIGRGVYLEDFEQQLKDEEQFFNKRIEAIYTNISILALLFFGIIIVLNFRVSKDIKKEFKNYSSQLKDVNERFKLAMETSQDGIWDWNPITNTVFYSRNWKQMLGYKENELEHTFETFDGLIHPEDKESVYNDVQAHIEKQTEYYESIYRLKHKNGTWLWTYARGKALFDKEGQPYRFIGFNTDLTLQKKQEEENIQKDTLLIEQSKNAQMGEMIANIAHQWRQPLSAISATASSMKVQKELSLLSDEELMKMLSNIIRNTEYLSKTIDTFRNYIKDNKEVKEVQIQRSINNALSIVKASLANNHITLINNVDYSQPLMIKTVVGELSQVIINLLNNAKDVMVEKEVRDRWIKVDLINKDNKKALIVIEDNGGGIPEDIISKIFDPYFTTKHQSQGTGLGLHMSKDIIEKHLLGELYVKNTENGAKFFIKLPLSLSK